MCQTDWEYEANHNPPLTQVLAVRPAEGWMKKIAWNARYSSTELSCSSAFWGSALRFSDSFSGWNEVGGGGFWDLGCRIRFCKGLMGFNPLGLDPESIRGVWIRP